MVIVPAYPMVVLGCRVECPELQFYDETAIQVLEQLVSPTFPLALACKWYLCLTLEETGFPCAWESAVPEAPSRDLEIQFMAVNKKFRYIGKSRAEVMHLVRLQWARHIVASIIDAVYEPVVRTGFSVNLNLWVRDVIYTRAGVPW